MILITGATGFVGSHLLEFLQEVDTPVRCLVRSEAKEEAVRSLGFEVVLGDIQDRDSLNEGLQGIETVVHLVGIIEEKKGADFEAIHVQGTNSLIEAAKSAGVSTIFFQSALGATPDSPYRYLKTKGEAEDIVRSSGIPYTIFKPSLILGKKDGFTERMKQLLTAGPVVPVPGDGEAKLQPIYIRDWVKCFQQAMVRGEMRNKTYELGGPEQLTYNEILKAIMAALGLDKPIVHIPMGMTRLALPFMGLARSAARVVGREIPEVTGELLALLSIDNICEIDSVKKNFGFAPMKLADALAEFMG
ncbi:MAG: NAD(P)H-binding protein [bacterium]|nr:NAD(P)H-binding protein [bacterium]